MAVVTLAEAKTHLNIATGVATHDTELTAFIARAEAAVASKCGPLASTATTSRVRGGGSVLALPVAPVVSLTSITPLGEAALTVADYLVTPLGVVEPVAGGSFPARWYDVVYVAGRATLPDDLKLGVLELIRHMWETQRGGSVRPGSRPSEGMANTMPGAAYLFPFRVEQLLAPYVKATI